MGLQVRCGQIFVWPGDSTWWSRLGADYTGITTVRTVSRKFYFYFYLNFYSLVARLALNMRVEIG